MVLTLQGDNGIFGDFTVAIILAFLLRDLTLIFCFSYVVYLMNINIQPKGILSSEYELERVFILKKEKAIFWDMHLSGVCKL